MKDGENKTHIIIDNGTDYCKAGLSVNLEPKFVFPTCVGYSKNGEEKIGVLSDNARDRNLFPKINYPIENGQVTNWDDMEKIWTDLFTNKLKVAPEEHNVMLTEAPFNPKEHKEKISQIMFETFQVPGLYITIPSVLSLLAEGKYTGTVVDLGEGISCVVPIYEGSSLPHSLGRLYFSGKELTKYMMKLIIEQLYKLSTDLEKEYIAKSIKEKACYVALDFEKEIHSVKPFDYQLPDGTYIIIKDERISCPEALFKPTMANKNNSIGEIFCDSIKKCDIDINKDLYNNIVLSGGVSMFKGLQERFTKEIKTLAPQSMKRTIKVIASPKRNYNAWIGGNILSSTSTFQPMWIKNNEYEEYGDAIVHRKCF